ncbi:MULTISPECIES: 16S rRNA (uracil(1498)-N(3))-methyltransferase [Acidiphilium]|uniref:Ribosomal RNA small subunit methyltransferase E n=1 Tax=Acidiphilium rubrum TaxID=526 RepID=A0A8G2FCL5_ACIRU|nr:MULTISPECIES: 16S rRNA (uracil(1498)-N(3))-methyltransferase [Acidiphilium]SIQ04304.1 16S rRNA (uracil1498-N3)-methyltransferase [Acidiphilium rubrum]
MASIIRLHVPLKLATGAVIGTNPAQAHYLGTVMRRRAGDTLRLFNGADGEFDGVIERIGRHGADVALGAQTRAPAPEPDCWLAFAPVKRDATDLIIEKATELGVAAIYPVFTAHSQTARINHERLTAIATEAAEQCERLHVPPVHEPRDLAQFLADFPPDRRLFVAAERSTAPPLVAIPHLQPHALLVGPEGGFAPAELDGMVRHGFVTLVSLGPRILRAETAAIAGLARLLAAPDQG